MAALGAGGLEPSGAPSRGDVAWQQACACCLADSELLHTLPTLPALVGPDTTPGPLILPPQHRWCDNTMWRGRGGQGPAAWAHATAISRAALPFCCRRWSLEQEGLCSLCPSRCDTGRA